METKISDLASCLDIPKDTLLRWIKQGSIPVQITSKNICLFSESVIKNWAVEHNLIYKENIKNKENNIVCEDCTLFEALKEGKFFYNIKGENIKDVLENSINLLDEIPHRKKDELLEKLLERENLGSTGIGKGVAVPHPRTTINDLVKTSKIFTFFLEKEAAFNAIDKKNVFVLFMLLTADTKIHLNLLSKLCFCIRDNNFIAFLKEKPSKEDILDKISKYEQEMSFQTKTNFQNKPIFSQPNQFNLYQILIKESSFF